MSEILLATVSTTDSSIDGEDWLVDAVEEARQMIDCEPADLLERWDNGSLIIEREDIDSYPGMSDRIIRYSIDESDLEGFRSAVDRALDQLAEDSASVDQTESNATDTEDTKGTQIQAFSDGYRQCSLGDIYYGKRLVVKNDTEVYYPLQDEVGDADSYEKIAERLKNRPLAWETNPNGRSGWLKVEDCPDRENYLGKVRNNKILCAIATLDDDYLSQSSLPALGETGKPARTIEGFHSALTFLDPQWEIEKEEEFFVVTDTSRETHWAWVDLARWQAFEKSATKEDNR